MSVSEPMRAQHEAAARHLLNSTVEKIRRRESLLKEHLRNGDRQQVIAELSLLKKVNDLAARECDRWKSPKAAGGPGEETSTPTADPA